MKSFLFLLMFPVLCSLLLVSCNDAVKDKEIELLKKELEILKKENEAYKKEKEESEIKLSKIRNSRVAIPDNNFERALIKLGYDDLIDGYVFKSGIKNCKELDVTNKDISDLTGIEAFTALTYLKCEYNQLTNLDVSKNTALDYLVCHSNQLTSLDVSKNTALTSLYCRGNKLDCTALKNKLGL